MAGRSGVRPAVVPQVQVTAVEDAATQRALDALASAVQDQQARRQRDVVSFNLVVGTNKVSHGLGRPCTGYTVTPTTVSAAFAHALDTTNPHPEREVWITVIGASQEGASVEIF